MKKEYNEVYAFLVVGKLTNGEQVYCLDKKEKTVALLNDNKVAEVLALVEDAEKNEDRYLFWTEKETEDEHKD